MMSTLNRDWLAKRLNRFFGYTVLSVVTLFLIAPVFFLIAGSLKVESEYRTYPVQFWPPDPQWDNYLKVFTMTPFATIALRTGLLALAVALISTLTSAMFGYAFARFRDVRGSGKLFGVVVSLLIVPGIVLLIPQFILYARLRLTNTYWPWVLGAMGGNSFFIFLFRQFFMGFPKELEEAAEVDGCGPFRIFWQIFLPNSKPVIATAMLFAFIGVWGDYLTPLILLNANKTLLGVALATAFKNPQGFAIHTVTNAAIVLYVLPLIVVFFFLQKHIIRGVVTSGLKG
jgi:ABC-type glycerol-3-phosphate transport system permease component